MFRRILMSFAICLGAMALDSHPAQAQDPVMDIILTIRARKVLEEDPQLAPLQLGLRIRGGIVTLWGPVPSLDLSKRAVLKLRSLAYVTDIRNHLAVQPDDYLPAAPPRVVTPAVVPTLSAPTPEPKTTRPNRDIPAEASLPAIAIPIPQQSLRIPLRDE